MNDGEVYQKKDDLYEILAQIYDVDESILKGIIDVQRKEKKLDIISSKIQQYESLVIQQQTTSDLKKKIQKIINVLKNILEHPFSQNDFSTDTYEQQRLNLIKKIVGNKTIIEFLKFLVQLTSIDDKFIQCGQNGLQLLVQMKVDLTNQSFEDVRIKNTSLIGANFVRCNYSGSELENVDISGVNINGALLINSKWKNMKIHKLNKLDGHRELVQSVCFSPDGTTLASGSGDKSIRLWDVKTGQQKAKLDGHSDTVRSVCFSSDGTILASGSYDKSIRLWDVKTGQQKAKIRWSQQLGLISMFFIRWNYFNAVGINFYQRKFKIPIIINLNIDIHSQFVKILSF